MGRRRRACIDPVDPGLQWPLPANRGAGTLTAGSATGCHDAILADAPVGALSEQRPRGGRSGPTAGLRTALPRSL